MEKCYYPISLATLLRIHTQIGQIRCLKTSLRTIELNEDFSPKLETESVVKDQTWTGIVTDKYIIYRNNESVAGPCSFTVINKDTKEQKH